jgi:hypothetical protein
VCTKSPLLFPQKKHEDFSAIKLNHFSRINDFFVFFHKKKMKSLEALTGDSRGGSGNWLMMGRLSSGA